MCSSGGRLLRVRSGVAGAIVLREFGVLSPDTLWLRGVVRFWNTLVEALEGSLHRAVAVSDWANAVDCRMQKWAWSLQRTLCDLDNHLPLDRQHMPPLDVHAVLALHATHEQRSWEGLKLNRALASVPVPVVASIFGGLPAATAGNALFQVAFVSVKR